MPGRSRGGRVHVIRALTTTATGGIRRRRLRRHGRRANGNAWARSVVTQRRDHIVGAEPGGCIGRTIPGGAIGSPAEWTTYISKPSAYTIEHPTGWVETPAANDWPVVGWPPPDGDSGSLRGPRRGCRTAHGVV